LVVRTAEFARGRGDHRESGGTALEVPNQTDVLVCGVRGTRTRCVLPLVGDQLEEQVGRPAWEICGTENVLCPSGCAVGDPPVIRFGCSEPPGGRAARGVSALSTVPGIVSVGWSQ